MNGGGAGCRRLTTRWYGMRRVAYSPPQEPLVPRDNRADARKEQTNVQGVGLVHLTGCASTIPKGGQLSGCQPLGASQPRALAIDSFFSCQSFSSAATSGSTV